MFRDNFVTIIPLLHKGTRVITTMTAVFIYVELTSKDDVQLFSSLVDNQTSHHLFSLLHKLQTIILILIHHYFTRHIPDRPSCFSSEPLFTNKCLYSNLFPPHLN